MNEKILLALEKLAAKLNTNVEHLWNILADQAVLHSLSFIIPIFLTVISSFIGIQIFKKKIKGWSDDSNSENAFSLNNVYLIICIAAFIISLLTFIFSFKEMLMFLNPEFFAFSELKDLFN